MDKRSEIRKGIDMRAPIPQAINRAFLQILEDYRRYLKQPNPLAPTFVLLDEYLAQGITDLMIDLDSEGVVIKVEREEFDSICAYCEYLDTCLEVHCECDKFKLEAGYATFEPLIEEEK